MSALGVPGHDALPQHRSSQKWLFTVQGGNLRPAPCSCCFEPSPCWLGALPLLGEAVLRGLARGHGHIPVLCPPGWGWGQKGMRNGGGRPPHQACGRWVPALKAALHLLIAQQPGI